MLYAPRLNEDNTNHSTTMEIFSNPTFVLFAILCLGLALGNIQIKGISLGSSGVLFVALAAGHFGLKVPDGVTGIGTALFVYCVGLGVGNRFFATLRSKGSSLVLLSVVVVGTGWLVTWLLSSVFGVEGPVAAGLFAGACTSTPAFAAAREALTGMDTSGLDIGYGVAYPFGVIGVVLFVQLMPRLLKKDLNALPASDKAGKDPSKIIRRVVTVTRPDLYGKNISEFCDECHLHCRITRLVKDNLLHPLQPENTFQEGTQVLIIGERAEVEHDAPMLGEVNPKDQHPRTFGDETSELIILNNDMCNKMLSELDSLSNYGITISRITRLGNMFIPTGETELIRNDVCTVVGTPEAIKNFAKACGHRSTAINATDILSLTGGVALGIIVGNITFSMGHSAGFSLGMAGGPLIVALILGHFGKIGPIAGYMPRPTRVLLMEFALMIFLAGAGVSGGEKLVETLQAQGLTMFLIGVGITTIPMVLGYILATKLLKMPLPETLGAICGAMTSTPALGAITAKTDRQEPVISYATAYPAALLMMTILAKLLLSLL